VPRCSRFIFVSALVSMWAVSPSEASTISCPTIGTFDRQATVSNVISCTTMGPVSGTPQESDVEAVFGSDWFNAGSLALVNGTDGWLTVNVTSGSWGALPAGGTWAIDPILWTLHPRAALTFHVGNGGGDPDWFFFEIDPGATSGTFSIQKLSGKGGGFSNVFLWADPPVCEGDCTPFAPVVTPEPGTLMLFGTGLAALALTLRRRVVRN
jgi:hypothetical protein